MLDVSLRIFSLINLQSYNQVQKTFRPFNLNLIKDENKNTLLHILFSTFSTNMELCVELC